MNARLSAFVLVLAALAALRPAFVPARASGMELQNIPPWPDHLENIPLTHEGLLPMESRLAAEFPGAVAAFDAEGKRVVMRWITQATRQLHPIANCLRAGGCSVRPAPAQRHPQTGLWGVVHAEKDGRCFLAREKIQTADGVHAWTDVSAWYWDALLHPDRGPWIAITVIEQPHAR